MFAILKLKSTCGVVSLNPAVIAINWEFMDLRIASEELDILARPGWINPDWLG